MPWLLSFFPARIGRRSHLPRAACWPILFSVATLALQADRLAPLSVEDLTRHADLVLHGKVLSKTVLRDPAGRIYTRVELGLIETWKGSIPGDTFVVVHGGGALGDERVEVSDQASYAPDEEVVAFLRLNDRGEGVTLSLSQGKFAVFPKSGSGEKFVASRYHGAGPGNGALAAQALSAPASGSTQPLRLLDLRQAVIGQAQGTPNPIPGSGMAVVRSRAETVSAMIAHPATSFPAGW